MDWIQGLEINFYTVAGFVGFLYYLLNYTMLQLRLIDGNGIYYTINCISAASLVLISLCEHFNLASALIQISWIIIGIVGLCIRVSKKNRRHYKVKVDHY